MQHLQRYTPPTTAHALTRAEMDVAHACGLNAEGFIAAKSDAVASKEPTFGLTPEEIKIAESTGMTLEAFAKAKAADKAEATAAQSGRR